MTLVGMTSEELEVMIVGVQRQTLRDLLMVLGVTVGGQITLESARRAIKDHVEEHTGYHDVFDGGEPA